MCKVLESKQIVPCIVPGYPLYKVDQTVGLDLERIKVGK